MDYHLYHHDDLDGLASGAIFLEFLKLKGDSIGEIHPLTYGPHWNHENWLNMRIHEPNIFVDFQYHPKATWWIDHHGSGFNFAGAEFQNNYRNDEQHHLDPNAKSACGLVRKFLMTEHGFTSNQIIDTLASEVDIMDTAGFKTLSDALDVTRPIKQIDFLLAGDKPDREKYIELRHQLLRILAVKPLEEIVGMAEFKNQIDVLKDEELKLNNELSDRTVLKKGIVFADASDMKKMGSYEALWKNFPDAPYGVFLKHADDNVSIRAIRNNLATNTKSIHLGNFARKYGGGGHEGVGAMSAPTKEEALKIADDCIMFIYNELHHE